MPAPSRSCAGSTRKREELDALAGLPPADARGDAGAVARRARRAHARVEKELAEHLLQEAEAVATIEALRIDEPLLALAGRIDKPCAKSSGPSTRRKKICRAGANPRAPRARSWRRWRAGLGFPDMKRSCRASRPTRRSPALEDLIGARADAERRLAEAENARETARGELRELEQSQPCSPRTAAQIRNRSCSACRTSLKSPPMPTRLRRETRAQELFERRRLGEAARPGSNPWWASRTIWRGWRCPTPPPSRRCGGAFCRARLRKASRGSRISSAPAGPSSPPSSWRSASFLA